jgi:hypothetical protein
MTVLAVDRPVVEAIGSKSFYPLDAEKAYEGAMMTLNTSGYAGSLAAGEVFCGHNKSQVDNSAGSAGDKNIEVPTGRYTLEVALVGLITDVRQPVYASDDATLTFVPTGNVFVGVIKNYISATKMRVEFRPFENDEFGPNAVRETKSDNYTIDAADNGKIIYVDTDAKVITLPATVIGLRVTLVNIGGYGTVALTIAPNASDKFVGNDLTPADDKDLVNTKATAQRGDFVTLVADGVDGWYVENWRGVWARQA